MPDHLPELSPCLWCTPRCPCSLHRQKPLKARLRLQPRNVGNALPQAPFPLERAPGRYDGDMAVAQVEVGQFSWPERALLGLGSAFPGEAFASAEVLGSCSTEPCHLQLPALAGWGPSRAVLGSCCGNSSLLGSSWPMLSTRGLKHFTLLHLPDRRGP